MVHDTSITNHSSMSERLLHPRTFPEFMEAMHVFTTLCTALGVVPPLAMATWQHHVVYKNRNGTVPVPWQFLYSMVLVNFHDIDNQISTLNVANIIQQGTLDYTCGRAPRRTRASCTLATSLEP